MAAFMALEVEGLPHLETEPDEPRLFETWLPSKVIKAYSLRYSCHPCKGNCMSAIFGKIQCFWYALVSTV